MIRAGAVAKQVIVELESMGVDIKTGATGDIADAAKAAFAGRTLDDYYTEGRFAPYHAMYRSRDFLSFCLTFVSLRDVRRKGKWIVFSRSSRLYDLDDQCTVHW